MLATLAVNELRMVLSSWVQFCVISDDMMYQKVSDKWCFFVKCFAIHSAFGDINFYRRLETIQKLFNLNSSQVVFIANFYVVPFVQVLSFFIPGYIVEWKCLKE